MQKYLRLKCTDVRNCLFSTAARLVKIKGEHVPPHTRSAARPLNWLDGATDPGMIEGLRRFAAVREGRSGHGGPARDGREHRNTRLQASRCSALAAFLAG